MPAFCKHALLSATRPKLKIQPGVLALILPCFTVNPDPCGMLQQTAIRHWLPGYDADVASVPAAVG